MINFRVVDLDAMIGQLRDAGIDIFNVSTMDGIGRFAHLKDPEGNAIELFSRQADRSPRLGLCPAARSARLPGIL